MQSVKVNSQYKKHSTDAVFAFWIGFPVHFHPDEFSGGAAAVTH